MKKSYHAPKAECINVETNIIAASTTRSIKSSTGISAPDATRNNCWGSVWNE